jgi:hypothetical protein
MPLFAGPKGLGIAMYGGGTQGHHVVINSPIDARGADPSIVPRLNAAMKETHDRTIKTVFALFGQGGAMARASGKRG